MKFFACCIHDTQSDCIAGAKNCGWTLLRLINPTKCFIARFIGIFCLFNLHLINSMSTQSCRETNLFFCLFASILCITNIGNIRMTAVAKTFCSQIASFNRIDIRCMKLCIRNKTIKQNNRYIAFNTQILYLFCHGRRCNDDRFNLKLNNL